MGATTHAVGKSQKWEGKARIVYILLKVKLLTLVEYLVALLKRDFHCSFLGGFPEQLFFGVAATLHKKWSFLLKISSVNVTKSAAIFYILK